MVFEHQRQSDKAHHHHRCTDNTRTCRQDRTHQYHRDRQPAAYRTEKLSHGHQEFFGHLRLLQYQAHEDEERYCHQRDVPHDPVGTVRQHLKDMQADLIGDQREEKRHPAKNKSHLKTEHQQHKGHREHQEDRVEPESHAVEPGEIDHRAQQRHDTQYAPQTALVLQLMVGFEYFADRLQDQQNECQHKYRLDYPAAAKPSGIG